MSLAGELPNTEQRLNSKAGKLRRNVPEPLRERDAGNSRRFIRRRRPKKNPTRGSRV
jgi:hypothetical protein